MYFSAQALSNHLPLHHPLHELHSELLIFCSKWSGHAGHAPIPWGQGERNRAAFVHIPWTAARAQSQMQYQQGQCKSQCAQLLKH